MAEVAGTEATPPAEGAASDARAVRLRLTLVLLPLPLGTTA